MSELTEGYVRHYSRLTSQINTKKCQMEHVTRFARLPYPRLSQKALQSVEGVARNWGRCCAFQPNPGNAQLDAQAQFDPVPRAPTRLRSGQQPQLEPAIMVAALRDLDTTIRSKIGVACSSCRRGLCFVAVRAKTPVVCLCTPGSKGLCAQTPRLCRPRF